MRSQNCRWTFIFVTAIVLANFAFCPEPLFGLEKSRPNVVVILSDDAGYADFGAYGRKPSFTPNIDRLAETGVRATEAYVTASVCCPSRAGLLTGRYQQRFGHEYNNFAEPTAAYQPRHMGLSVDENTIGRYMQQAGYRTMAIGKWHMGTQAQFFPLNRGFDAFFGFKGGARSYFPIEGDIRESRKIYENSSVVPEEELSYLTDDLTSAAVEFIEHEREKPFFLYLAYNAPHGPMHAREQDLEKFKHVKNIRRRKYMAMMHAMDRGVGRVIDTLDRHGLRDNTLVIFTNDNGGATNNGSDNGPLRGMKGSKWEGGIRVPFIASWPERLPQGTSYNEPISLLDIVPTTLNAAGESTSAEASVDGVNLLPYFRGKQDGPPHEILFWRRGVAAGVRQGPWKLIRVAHRRVLLFRIDEELGADGRYEADYPFEEAKNVADQNPAVVRRLLNRLNKWEAELAPPRWREGEKWWRFQIKKHRMNVLSRSEERRFP
jgi:arylsulfatase A-like enzyme